ncbi:hypothetical protein KUCAC02_000457 [Chaenocephalus aceratus]|uniref:Uncharacterized protein n=1 Tax=Chaenocephalus aceratus TaxID=36190 RepID=A0ACB9W6V2_CHAAC|nr:hypothetical protein KUCAC02_000457 [Chaenocephalus aceratus]
MFLLLSFTWIIAGITAEIPPAMHYRVKNSSLCLHIKPPGYQVYEWLFEKDIIVHSKNIKTKYKDKVYYNPKNGSLCITKLNETDSGTYSLSFINSNDERAIETHKLIVEETVPRPFIRSSPLHFNLSADPCNITVNCSVQGDWVCSVCDNNSCTISQRSLFSKVNITIFLHNRVIVCSGNNNVTKSNVSESMEGMCFGKSNPEPEVTLKLHIVILICIALCVSLCAFAVCVPKRLFQTECNQKQTSPARIIQSQPAEEQSNSVPRVSSSTSSQAWYENVDDALPCQTSSPNISPREELGSKREVDTVYNKNVILESPASTLFEGESVTLRCRHRTQREENAAFFRDGSLMAKNTVQVMSDGSSYSCRFGDEESELITLRTETKPKAQLRDIFPGGGNATLTCSVGPSSASGWRYFWYKKGKTSEPLKTQDVVFLTNDRISVSRGGVYWCRGGRGDPVYYTEYSDAVVTNRAVVTLQPKWPEIYSGEPITLTCEIEDGGDYEWEVCWRPPGSNTSQKSHLVPSSRSGKYQCVGRLKAKPKAQLRDIFPGGGNATLTCSVGPSSASGWRYFWSKKGNTSEPLKTQDVVFLTNDRISVSRGGVYWCRGGRGDPVYYTEYSDAVVTNRAVVTLRPNWPEMYSGERITLTCEIKDGGDSEWDYIWMTPGSKTPPTSDPKLTLTSQRGDYGCKGRLKDVEAPNPQHEIHTKVGDTVELSSGLSTEGVTQAQWIYEGLKIADDEAKEKGQRPTVIIILFVHEPITKEPIVNSSSTWHTSNASCTVVLECSAATTGHVTYQWTVGTETFNGFRLQHILRQQDEDTKFNCTISNVVSEMSTIKTVSCSNTTSEPQERGKTQFPAGTGFFSALIVGAGVCLLVAVIVGVAVCVYRHKQSQAGVDSNDLTVYADINDVAIGDPCSLYETIDNRGNTVPPGPNTVYDKIQLNRLRKESVSPYQDIS